MPISWNASLHGLLCNLMSLCTRAVIPFCPALGFLRCGWQLGFGGSSPTGWMDFSSLIEVGSWQQQW